MGRPTITLTLEQVHEVETLAAVLSVQQIADYFGIARSTFFNLLERDPDIARHYRRGKARAIGSIAQSLIAKARAGDTASAIFYLKTQAGWREAFHVEDSSPARDTTAVDKLRAFLNQKNVPRVLVEADASRSDTPMASLLLSGNPPSGSGS